MARNREDFLINLTIISQNLAEGDLSKLEDSFKNLENEAKSLKQSEDRRNDTLRAAQRETAGVTKENNKLISSNKALVKANLEETKSILDKAEAVDKQNFSYQVFSENLNKTFANLQRRMGRQQIEIETRDAQANLVALDETISNINIALEKADKDEAKNLTKYKERLLALREIYKTELNNLNLAKAALADQEKQIKNSEDILKAREKSEEAERKRLRTQEQAKKLDKSIADIPRKRAAATRQLIDLLEQEEKITRAKNLGGLRELAYYKEWEQKVEKAKRQLEEFGATEQDIALIEENASRTREDRDLKLAEARAKYAKALSDENKIKSQSITLDGEQTTKLEVLKAKKAALIKEIELLGGSYQDLNTSLNRNKLKVDDNSNAFTKLRNIVKAIRTQDSESPFAGFLIAFKRTTDSAAILSRRLGRLGLAIRGLVIVGILSFMQAFVSVIGALGAQLVALVGSLLSAATVLGGAFVSAVAQAIPVVGLLAAAFNRLSAIQEAVNQADLAKKNAFGDTGAEEAATDAALQIADAQLRVKEAQEGVTEARKEARKELEELILKEKEAELALKGAVLSQLEARRALRETIGTGDVESVARDQLGIQESNLGTVRARRDLREARQARRQGLRGGPEGTDTYKNAVRALTDAQRALAQAQRSAADSADTQSAAQRNLAFFLSQLSEAERKLFKQFMKARERYDKVFRPITDIIINAFSSAFTRVEKLLFSSEIVKGFRELATIVGSSFDRLSKTLTSPVFKEFFVEIIGQAADNMPLLTDAIILLADIFRNIAIAAAPAFRAILEFIVEKLGEFNDTVSDTNSFSDFLMMGVEHFEAWIELIVAILGLFGQLMQASSDSALETLTSLTDTINGAKDSLKADDSGARSFFDDAAESAKEMGRVIVALGEAIIELTSSEQVKALADIFTEALIPGMVMGIKVVGNFALFLDKLVEVPVVSHMLQLGAATFFVVSAFSAVNAIFQPFLIFVGGMGQAFGKLLLRFTFFQNILKTLKGSISAVSLAISKIWWESNKAASIWGIFSSVGSKILDVFKALAATFRSGGLIAGIKSISTGLKAIPVVGLAIGLAIDLIIGAITALIENFGGIRDYVVDQFKGLLKDFENLGSSIGALFEEIFGEGAFKDFLGVLLDIGKAIFNVIGFIGKLAGALAIGALVNAIIVPLRLIVNILSTIIEYIANVIGAFKKLFSGEISFGEFVAEIGSAIESLVGGILGAIGNTIASIFTALANIVFAALKEALNAIFGESFATEIINTVIGIINWIIDKVNSVTPDFIGDIGRIAEVQPEQTQASSSDSSGRGRARDINAETDSQKKNNKAKKDAAKSSLENYEALNLSGGASKRNTKLNNQLADSLGRSSRQHKRAQNLQEALAESASRSRRQQELYANSVARTARAEERYANSLARARRIRGESNQRDKTSVKIRENLAGATNKVARVQGRYYSSTIKSAAAGQLFNKSVKTGTNLQDKYEKHLNKSTNAAAEQRKGISKLSSNFGSLNKVLATTGQNSRALGIVFKTVTNRILTEFNVKPLKLQLPSVAGMFKQTMGGNTQNFQKGGYFGNKGMRGPDDRTIMVAGGEAILTGNHQAAVDTAFGIANQTAGFPYKNLDHMFNRDKRPHASAKRFNRGGKIPGYARGGNVVIPKNIPDAAGALPGLDLMAFLLGKYFGLSVTSGLRAYDYGSDHSWGGAVDVSNGTQPTPEMDAAWNWLAKTIGGGGSWVENYSGGAIKQMLYRTNIGGNHFNHIHLALLDNYARSTKALIDVLEGKAVPTGGGMFMQAPTIKKPKIKGDMGVPRDILQGQSDMLTRAANEMLKNKIQPLSGKISLKNMGSFDSINKIYAEHNSAEGDWGGATLPFNLVAALAQAAGMPGITFAQIAKGESGLRPGATGIDPGGTKGLGLWMITTGYNDELIASFGGQAQMRNPVKNAMAAKKIYDSMGTGAWYGTKFVTDFNKPYRGKVPDMPHNRGGLIPEFNDGGIVPGPIGAPRLVKAHGGETILPTHKYNTGGMVPRYQTGGRYDGIPSNTTVADVRNVKTSRLQSQITALTKRLQNAETQDRRNFLQERIAELKDQLLLSKEVKAYNKEIKNINKDINKKKKEIRNADEEDRKELEKELRELQRDLAAKKKDKRATVAFEGELYNTSAINEFILLISDRINSFMKRLEEEVSRMAIATARWTYKIVNVDGKKIVSRVNSAVDEATKGLQDLVNETGLIVSALAESNRGERRARARLKKVRDNYSKKINKAQKALDRARNIQDEEEREKAVKQAKKDLEELRKSRKEDIQKLQTSIKNSNNKQKELQERLAENLAARYEQQIAIFEEEQAVLESELSAFDTQIEIASLQFADNDGNLSEEGKNVVRGFYEQRARTLEQQRANIQEELNAARAAKDIERSRELEQALLENQLALLQNTNSIKELDDSVQEGLFDFKSTNWEQFRQAIFSNGTILPQFQSQIPQLATGGYVTREGLAYLHAAEVVVPASKTGNAGPLVDTINFTQPMETADPVAISNQIGFKLSTLKSL